MDKKAHRDHIDHLIYDEKTWPKLNMEEKRDAVASFTGMLIRYYHEVMEEQIGREKTKEVGSEVWKRLIRDGLEVSAESLGIYKIKNAISFIKWNAYLEEEELGCMAKTLEATPERGSRAVMKCPIGDRLRKEDCAYMIEGAKRCVEEHYPGYTFCQESVYQDSHMCIYKIQKIEAKVQEKTDSYR